MLPPTPLPIPPEPPGPDEVVRAGDVPGIMAPDIAGGAAGAGVARDDRVAERRTVGARGPLVKAPPAAAGRVAADRAGRQVRPGVAEHAPSAAAGRVAADGALEQAAGPPILARPPPLPAAVLPMIVQSVSVAVPWLYRPPPIAALPPEIVSPEIVAVTPAPICNTRPVPPPASVRPAAGPSRAIGPPVPVSRSGPAVRVMVWARRRRSYRT